MRRFILLVLASALATSGLFVLACDGEGGGGVLGELVCSDGLDNDGDTTADCEDPDCIGTLACTETDCDDDLDNDGDGLVDCDDIDDCGTDDDLDTFSECQGDCDDTNPAINPGAVEACNGIDDDCDGAVPAGEADADLDGFRVCQNDCDDAPATGAFINPGAQEICDTRDNDCDTLIDAADPSNVGTATWYADADGDGFGDPASSLVQCDQPEGYVLDATDCDDSDDSVFPGATEACNDVDDDCDGETDEGCDDDADDYCDDALALTASATCPNGGGDCNDSVAAVNPGATEICNGVDDDCDDSVDEGCDDDDDNYCDAGLTTVGTPPTCTDGGGDCDDAVAAINPGATEICNDVDDDCDGATDEGCDDDGDDYCDSGMTVVGTPATCSSGGGDCNDGNAAVNPGATEICATVGVDDDCDGAADEPGAPDGTLYYVDADGDGYGDSAPCGVECGVRYCSDPGAGFSLTNDDCDDGDDAVNPGATEICNDIDDDCDTFVDDDDPSLVATTWYRDQDNDTYGTSEPGPQNPKIQCDQPNGYVDRAGDCDDSGGGAGAINPGAAEICDGIDNDCDTFVDDDDPNVTGRPTWYEDFDGDGYGNPDVSATACVAPAGHVEDNTDCNDTDMGINPGAAEECDTVDNDCDDLVDAADPDFVGSSTFYVDGDGDGYGAGAGEPFCSAEPPAGYSAVDTDCDDGNAAINPGAAEICDGGIDNNCNGTADDADGTLTGATTWYQDADGDTYGNPAVSLMACVAPAGYVADNTDCKDTGGGASGVNPGAAEICDDGGTTDEDCDGLANCNDTGSCPTCTTCGGGGKKCQPSLACNNTACP